MQSHVDDIRKMYEKDWESKDVQRQQMGCALYFIDQLALRAGHEKDEDEADTVGCCTLKVCILFLLITQYIPAGMHLHLHPNILHSKKPISCNTAPSNYTCRCMKMHLHSSFICGYVMCHCVWCVAGGECGVHGW